MKRRLGKVRVHKIGSMVALYMALVVALGYPGAALSADPLALHQLIEVPTGDEVVVSLAGYDLDGDKVRLINCKFLV